MKRKTKEIIILMITIIMLILLATNVQATSTFNAIVGASTTTLKPGEEVKVTISVSDINMGENGINTLEGKIKYDSNVFEEVKSSSIQSLNNWTTTFNDESSTLNGKFLAVNLSSGVKESVQIFTVTFKVKTDLKETTETQIDFEDITSNDGVDLISAGTKSVKLTVNVENSGDSTTDVPDDDTNNIIDNIVTENKNTISKDNTQSSGILPNTGKSIMIGTALLVGIIVVVILAIKNKSYNDIK